MISRELAGKVAVVTEAAAGIGLASTEATEVADISPGSAFSATANSNAASFSAASSWANVATEQTRLPDP
jgi:hypothetical protein